MTKAKQAIAAIVAVVAVALIARHPEFLRRFAAEELLVGAAVLRVEIADSPSERENGLGGRGRLAEDEGMLFLFADPEIQNFWMKDMRFPIDIVWIRDGKVIGMAIGVEPEPGPDYTIYRSPEPVDMVLEINAGAVPRLGIKVGDEVSYN